MKYLNKILYLFVVSAIVTSCDRDFVDTNFGQPTIGFASETADLYVEDGAINQISIELASTAVTEGNVNYSISVDPTSTAFEGTEFTIVNSSTSFANGEMFTNLIIEGDFANADYEGEVAKLILTSNQAQISQDNSFDLNIFKVCEISSLNTLDYNAEVFALGDTAPSHSVTLTPVAGEDRQWTITSSWGPEFLAWATGDPAYSGLFVYSGTIILNDDLTVDFIGDEALTPGGTGVFIPCPQEFNITLTQDVFTNPFTVDVVLSPM
ncbi:hypothetical protein [Olleya sp. Bg11-27]|uniref:hypothetical protein n=1 Tax=Olleya sp. Bg11-27 TaxID=2058135 RepID=UPI000C31642B|nr:hypothetical protein [Olleya sp. Bg11-27]AUC77490.1 hypothetical protein CW732_18125 [Olleya sp. Bg11-27]